MKRNYFALGALMFAIGVGMGALGAHGLEGRISDHYLDVWKKASEYWMYSALGTMSVSAFVQNKDQNEVLAYTFFRFGGLLTWAILGSFIFSISLWVLVINELWGLGLRKLGMITPIGGVMMIVSWIIIAIKLFRNKRSNESIC
jgi:uncharacterized membrane protein YgdD (TMEM256/DUF423 family)